MTDILPPAGWPNVRQLETNEFASGGANGNMNEQAKSLAARSELLKQYAALPYESKTGGYALNERVQLATGDIVKSTVANNSTNPNINMTGWFVPYMRGSQNLVELTDKATARNNLDVMSATEVNTAISNAIPPTTPNATETVAGKAKIATTAIAQAGTNDTDFITPKKLLDFIKTNVIKSNFVDVKANRTIGVTYTNPSTSQYLNVRINALVSNGGSVSAYMSDKLVMSSTISGGAAWGEYIFLLVPPLATYRLAGVASIQYWGEA